MITREAPPAGGGPHGAVGRALWWAYERAPGGCDALFQLGRRHVMPVLRHRVPVSRLSGPTAGGGPRATLVTTGSAMTLDLLVRRFFDGRPEVEPLGAVSLPRLPGVLERLAPTADLILACVPRAFAGWFGERYLRVPALAGARLPVGATVEAILVQAARTVRYDVRRALAKGYGWAFSRGQADFERFYDEFYRPSVRARFGPLAVVREREVLRRHFRHGGGLIWLHRDGRAVAGELVRGQGRRLRSLVAGVHPSWQDRSDPSPQFALNLATCDVAVRRGFSEVDFGGSVPSLRDGVLRSKRAWGAVVGPWEESHRDILVRWPAKSDQTVRQFLDATPLLFEGPSGLCAVAAVEPGRPTDVDAAADAGARLWRQYAPRGLRRLCLLGAADGPSRHAPDGRPAPDGPILLCPAGDAAAINRAAGATP
jgi:Acetyltransferase (GNAT) domain